MRLSRDELFGSVDRPRSCERVRLLAFTVGYLGAVARMRCGVVEGKAVRRVGLCFMWSVL